MQLLLLLLLLRELLLHLLHLLNELSCLRAIHDAACTAHNCAVWREAATAASDNERRRDELNGSGAVLRGEARSSDYASPVDSQRCKAALPRGAHRPNFPVDRKLLQTPSNVLSSRNQM